VAKGQMDVRVWRQVHGGDLHVQAGPFDVVAFEVADIDVLGWGGADDEVGAAVGDAAVFAYGGCPRCACGGLGLGAEVPVDTTLAVLVLETGLASYCPAPN
jgi:hypothetical protein